MCLVFVELTSLMVTMALDGCKQEGVFQWNITVLSVISFQYDYFCFPISVVPYKVKKLSVHSINIGTYCTWVAASRQDSNLNHCTVLLGPSFPTANSVIDFGGGVTVP